MPISQIWHSIYTLRDRRAGGGTSDLNRRGALLKVQYKDGRVGFADCFPWHEFGDARIDEQLYDLAKGKASIVMMQTLALAQRDAAARRLQRNLMRGVPRVRNHFLVSNVNNINPTELGAAKQLGYIAVKLKCGVDLQAELSWIKRMTDHMGFLVRLDFGARLKENEYVDFLSALTVEQKNKIEFVEDPFPFDLAGWRRANQIVPIALDFEINKIDFSQLTGGLPFKVIIIKPARQKVERMLDLVNRYGTKMVMTSSLDHPVGVMHAAAIAGETKQKYPNILLDCGCFSHTQYQEDDFSKLMPRQGPMLSEVLGTGIGFDEALTKQNWELLEVK